MKKQLFGRRSVGLDKLFGHPLSNIPGEPITPTKIAIFYLIRTLFHAHFGVRSFPSLNPLNKQDKTKAFTILYGLIFMESEISYNDCRGVVRMLDIELGRSVYYNFVRSMESLAQGVEQIEMLFEDAFYTSKRSQNETVLGWKNEPINELSFMSSNSFLYIWIKRVMFQYTRTPQKELFEVAEQLRMWIIAGNLKEMFPPLTGINLPLPFEIDCSVRTRLWINLQLRLIQFCPSKAMPYNQIMDWCEVICQRHPDVCEVYLLKAVVYVQLKTPLDAVKSLYKFFDMSMLQMTENSTEALDTLELMTSCQVALRYGPILLGRVHRYFGNHYTAGSLFAESIQQSQVNIDDMCNRVANMELTVNSILMSGPLLERISEDKKYRSNINDEETKKVDDRRVLQSTIHAAVDLNVPNIRSLQKSFKEDYDLHSFLVSMSKLMLCIEDMMDGKYFNFNCTPDYVSLGLHRLRLLFDPQQKGKVLEDFATAIMSSGLIQSGMYYQARRVSESMIVNNCEWLNSPKFETESHAVAGANLVYSMTAVGDYEKALAIIATLESQFPEDINWMAARHVTLCAQIVRFEKNFLLGRYSACFNYLKGLETIAPLEFSLRKSLLLAATGRLDSAVKVLHSYKCYDVRGKMRIHMQLATIHNAHGYFEKAAYHLDEAGKIAINSHFLDANFLVARRIGSMMLARRMPQDAHQIFLSLRSKVENFGSYIEKAIYNISVARCLRLLKKDPRVYLKKCKLQITNNKWPAMEKLLLSELAALHDLNGMFPNESKAAWVKEHFGKIESDYPGSCTWMLI